MATVDRQQLLQLLDAADQAGDAETAQEIASLLRGEPTGPTISPEVSASTSGKEKSFENYLEEQAGEYSPVEAVLIGAGKTFTDIGRGAQNIYAKVTGNEGMQANIAQRQGDEGSLYLPLKQEQPAATLGGELLPYLATAPIGGTAALGTNLGTRALLGTGKGLFGRAGEQAAVGAALGGLTYGENQGAQAGLAGAIGGAVPFVGAGLGKGATALRGRLADAAKMGEVGAPLTPGQRLGGTLGRGLEAIEEAYSRMPIIGGALEPIKRKQQRAINRMAAESIGETSNKVTSDVLANAAQRIGQDFEQVIGGSPFKFSRDSTQKLVNLRRTIINDELDAPVAKKIATRLLMRVRGGGVLSANEYKKINSRIGKKFGSSIDADEREALGMLKDTLDDLVGAQMSPKRTAQWNTAREQWRNLRTLEKGSVVDTVSGNVSGPKLANVLQRQSPRSFSSATDSLSRAGQIGRELKPTVGNSGTATAMLPWLAAGGAAGGALNPESPIGLGAGALALPYAYRLGGRMGIPAAQRTLASGAEALASRPGSSVLSRGMAGIVPGLLE